MTDRPQDSGDQRSLPFAGIKVIDISRVLASPFTSAQLAYLGATVIKIEEPGTGDPARFGHSLDPAVSRSGMSSNFLSQNASKQSLTLDLRSPDGQQILRKLAQDADVLIQNLRTGTMERYGLGYEQLRTLNPRLVYCSVTAYGATGSKQRHPAYDPVVQAASGMMAINGTPDTTPVKVGPPVIDYGTGLTAAFAISTALFQRSKTGTGQHIDVSMLDTAFVLMGSIITDAITNNKEPKVHGNTYASIPTNSMFETKQGRLYVAAMQQHQVRNFLVAIQLPGLVDDPRYATLEQRKENLVSIKTEVQAALLGKTAQEWEEILNEAGVPAMRMRTLLEAVNERYVADRNVFHVFPNVPGVGRPVTIPTLSFKMSGTPAPKLTPPPTLGADTETILAGLGYSTADIARLKDKRVI